MWRLAGVLHRITSPVRCRSGLSSHPRYSYYGKQTSVLNSDHWKSFGRAKLPLTVGEFASGEVAGLRRRSEKFAEFDHAPPITRVAWGPTPAQNTNRMGLQTLTSEGVAIERFPTNNVRRFWGLPTNRDWGRAHNAMTYAIRSQHVDSMGA